MSDPSTTPYGAAPQPAAPHGPYGTASPSSAQVPFTGKVDQGTARLLPDLDRDRAWLLTVEEVPQSHVDLDDPQYLEFEYVRRMGHVLDATATPGHPLDLLHLGGGALTLPRYAACTRPGSRQLVAESDGALSALVAERLPLPAGADIEVHTADAATTVRLAAPGGADLVVADVFARARTPASLTGAGFAAAAARALRPGGRYVANLADGAPFDFLRSQLANLAAALPHLCLIAEAGVLRGRRYGNAVVVASQEPLPVAALARRCAADPFPARVVDGDALVDFIGDAPPVPDAEARPSPPPPDDAFTLG